MKLVKVSAPGKVILAGEQAAVYGEKAVLAAVKLRCRVTVKFKCQNSNDKSMSKPKVKIVDKNPANSLDLLKLTVKECMSRFKFKDQYVELEIDSELPIGSGLGSSAAMATAVATGLLGQKDEALIDEVVLKAEKIQHGIASGADQAVVKLGGFISFRRKNGGFEVEQLRVRGRIPKVVLVDSGRPKENTGEMVASVAAKHEARSTKFETIFRKIGEISEEWEELLQGRIKNYELRTRKLIKENQRLLEEMGVVGEKAKKMVREIEKIGGAAKVCGAGGVKEGSGVLMAVHEDYRKLLSLAEKMGWDKYEVELGVEGVRWQEK